MKKDQSLSRYIVTASLIAAIYTALTYISAAMGLAYGEIQFRLSECLYILSAFTPTAIPGITIGCILGNLGSPLGLIDILFGASASLLAALSVRIISKYCGKATPYLAIIPPALCNGVIVGLEIMLLTSDERTFSAFAIIALSVAIGEIVISSVLGIPLYFIVKSNERRIFR